MTTHGIIIRHGERLDHVQKSWQPEPSIGLWDPPLTQQGFEQAIRTGQHLTELMNQYSIDPGRVVLYTSPFRRCVETSMGIVQAMPVKPVLRVEIGLGEWMCERFFDAVCEADELVSQAHQRLAREQANAYARHQTPLKVDYAYQSCRRGFDFPESYVDMVRRFEETRLACLKDQARLVLFVTHAVGVNALLDGFRHHLTRPLQSNYCSVSIVSRQNKQGNDEYADPHSPWSVDMAMSDTHLLV
ncbi:histidine phosphatase superfamily [Sporodiniella umbellata]|nr:histidine phosphatase superfamily [Sporodiniella umbellata]